MSDTAPAPGRLELEHVACDLCGGESYRVRYRQPDRWARVVPFAFPVVECRSCGLVYVNPRPTPESVRLFYPAGYHRRSGPEHQRRYALQAALLPDLTGLRVLDFGCAEGDFLRYLRGRFPGAGLFGSDLYAPAAPAAEGIAIHRGELAEAPFAPGSFDLATAWGVIEHLHEPLRILRLLRRLLKPAGRLVLLVTNAESLYGRRAHREDVPRHLYHFSERTLGAYASRSGFVLQACAFDDLIFDGRGAGTFWHTLTKLAGAGWESRLDGRFKGAARVMAHLGGLLDRAVFATHWERRLRRSGIMIATLVGTGPAP